MSINFINNDTEKRFAWFCYCRFLTYHAIVDNNGRNRFFKFFSTWKNVIYGLPKRFRIIHIIFNNLPTVINLFRFQWFSKSFRRAPVVRRAFLRTLSRCCINFFVLFVSHGWFNPHTFFVIIHIGTKLRSPLAESHGDAIPGKSFSRILITNLNSFQ